MIAFKLVVNKDKEGKLNFDTTVNCSSKEVSGYFDYIEFMLLGKHPDPQKVLPITDLDVQGVSEEKEKDVENALLQLIKSHSDTEALNILYRVIFNANIMMVGLKENQEGRDEQGS